MHTKSVAIANIFPFTTVLFLIFTVPTFLQAQNGDWTVFNSSNSDLPNDVVKCIAFDEMGNAWIGTKGGVAKYNDINWTVYNAGNSDLPENDIKALAVDSQNNIYIGTNKQGLAILDGTTFNLFNSNNSDLPSDLITDVLIDDHDNLWISTQGGGIVNFDGSTWRVYDSSNSSLTDDYVYSLTRGADGSIWAGTYKTLAKFNGTSWDVLNVGAGFYCFDLVVKSNGMACAASPGGFRIIDWPNITLYTADNSRLPSTTVDAVALDPEEGVWIGTFGGGLAFLDIDPFTVFDTQNSGLPHNDVDALAFDTSGNLWIGTNGGGLAIFETNITPPPPPHSAKLKWIYKASATIEWFDRWEDGFAAGDLNDDNLADVVFGTAAGDVVAVNSATGVNLWTCSLPATGTSVNADIVDVDGDGVLDVVAGGKASSGNTTIVALNKDGSLKWQANGDYQETTDLAYGDINNDGTPDVAAAIGTYSTGGGQVILLDGQSGSRIWDVALGSGIAFGIDAKDINGDGDMEVAVTNYNNKVFFIDGKSDSILWSNGGTYYGRDVIIEDLDNDDSYEVIAVMGNLYCYDSMGILEWTNSAGAGENLMLFDSNKSLLLIANPWVGKTSLANGTSGEIYWTRDEAGLADFGDVDGNGTKDIVVISTKYYDPNFLTQHIRAIDSSNSLLWEHQLENEPTAIVVANIDADPADEVLVSIDKDLYAFDVLPASAIDFFSSATPEQFTLLQNYPNPFNPTTNIEYAISKAGHVSLSIFDVLGRHIRTLEDSRKFPGHFQTAWDGTNERGIPVAGGLYFCRMQVDEYYGVIKMVLVR
ncbi:hypothetical protein EH223_08865 [candidate division KSB1 bacterium]|nr:VCBS repeat-containing protein [candidate division KSB1 bacterium]RQW03833.1 MAG: hypothetical protein EH223_08865 [candidate division KSB1 bacterium]